MSKLKIKTPNKTTEFYNKLNTRLYILGLPDFWIEDVILPKTFVKIYNVVVRILNIVLGSLAAMICLSLFTQKNLDEDQRLKLNVNALMVPTVYFYYLILTYRRAGIREILYKMGVLLKEVHNDKEVEKKMIKNVKFFVSLYFCSGILSMSQAGATLIYKFFKGEPLVTIVTAWPDVNEKSQMTDIIGCVIYILWWCMYLRTVGSHIIIFTTIIGISHQFKNTQSYFHTLNNIFNHLYLSQKEKEDKFEKAFRAGIKMHATTLWCTKQCQILCGMIFHNQALLATIIIIPLVYENMKPENNPAVNLPPALFGIMISSLLWCNAGNITVEALKVSDAMYCSGWQNCFGKSSVRVRKLVVIAMSRAQKPVVLTACNFIELTYESFCNLLKSAYTAFVIFF